MDCEAIWKEANEAARAAVRGARHLENPQAFDCGFAWVLVQPARGPFISWLRAEKKEAVEAAKRHAHPTSTQVRRAEQEADSKFGHVRDYGGGGWQFWMPGRAEHNGQSIAVFEAGANAFADVLKRHGIPAEVGSRLD